MAQRSIPKVVEGTLSFPAGEPSSIIAVDSSAWFTWLDGADRFVYAAGPASFTARKQPRRGRPYWYAYKRRGGTLRCVYLGRSADLTRERLRRIAAQFDEERTEERLDLVALEQHLVALHTSQTRGTGAEAVKLADQLYQVLVAERQWAATELAALQQRVRQLDERESPVSAARDRHSLGGEVF